jgi:hypothetical protein
VNGGVQRNYLEKLPQPKTSISKPLAKLGLEESVQASRERYVSLRRDRAGAQIEVIHVHANCWRLTLGTSDIRKHVDSTIRRFKAVVGQAFCIACASRYTLPFLLPSCLFLLNPDCRSDSCTSLNHRRISSPSSQIMIETGRNCRIWRQISKAKHQKIRKVHGSLSSGFTEEVVKACVRDWPCAEDYDWTHMVSCQVVCLGTSCFDGLVVSCVFTTYDRLIKPSNLACSH